MPRPVERVRDFEFPESRPRDDLWIAIAMVAMITGSVWFVIGVAVGVWFG